jgi:ABC-type glycerol-3-phosphate transport system substrate-binding protein
MVLAYKNDTNQGPPADWNAVLASEKPLAFSASDPRSVITLANYQSLLDSGPEGTNLADLREDALLDLFSYYQSAQTANVMPYWLTQFETDQQAWQSYVDRQSTMVITWSSFIFNSETVNTSLSAIPTRDARPFAYADGWVWCVIPSDQETEAVALELAAFLVEEDFLNIWSVESGYMPIYLSGLDAWSGGTYFSALQQLLPSALLLPDNPVKDQLGLPLRDAVTGVLKDQVLPEVVVSALLEKFQAP